MCQVSLQFHSCFFFLLLTFDFLSKTEGTTLRTYLSKVLNCDPMRITKKYTGNSSIGKRTFTPLVRSPENVPFIEMSQRELEDLRRNWMSKLLLAEQWNHRKLNLMKNVKSFSRSDNASPMIHTYNNNTGTNNILTTAGSVDDNEGSLEGNQMESLGDPNANSVSKKMKFNEETVAESLKPYLADPEKLTQILSWLKSSCSTLNESDPTLEVLDKLIKQGELSVPSVENVLKSIAFSSPPAKPYLQKPVSRSNSRSNSRGITEEDGRSNNEMEDQSGNEEKESNSNAVRPKGMKAMMDSQSREQLPPMMIPYPGFYNFPGYLPPQSAASSSLDNDKGNSNNKGPKRKRDVNGNEIPFPGEGNYPFYYPPNYLYPFPPAPLSPGGSNMTYPSPADYPNMANVRMPSYPEYFHPIYMQHPPPEAYYDPMYLRQMNQWMAAAKSANNNNNSNSNNNNNNMSSNSIKQENTISEGGSPKDTKNSSAITTTSSSSSKLGEEGVSPRGTKTFKATGGINNTSGNINNSKILDSASPAQLENLIAAAVLNRQKSPDPLDKLKTKPKSLKSVGSNLQPVHTHERVQSPPEEIESAAEALLGLFNKKLN
jgi:hypothetical protein